MNKKTCKYFPYQIEDFSFGKTLKTKTTILLWYSVSKLRLIQMTIHSKIIKNAPGW